MTVFKKSKDKLLIFSFHNTHYAYELSVKHASLNNYRVFNNSFRFLWVSTANINLTSTLAFCLGGTLVY